MKKHILDFLRRGCVSCGIGPLVLAVLYLSLQGQGVLQTLTINQVCTGIFSVTALAFIAGGMNAIYQIERLPLMMAILIHGVTLYVSYLTTYLLNGWLNWGATPILVFSGIFVVGYLAIWAIIYSSIKKKTDRINDILKKQRKNTEIES
jgi:hypothetical protein